MIICLGCYPLYNRGVIIGRSWMSCLILLSVCCQFWVSNSKLPFCSTQAQVQTQAEPGMALNSHVWSKLSSRDGDVDEDANADADASA